MISLQTIQCIAIKNSRLGFVSLSFALMKLKNSRWNEFCFVRGRRVCIIHQFFSFSLFSHSHDAEPEFFNGQHQTLNAFDLHKKDISKSSKKNCDFLDNHNKLITCLLHVVHQNGNYNFYKSTAWVKFNYHPPPPPPLTWHRLKLAKKPISSKAAFWFDNQTGNQSRKTKCRWPPSLQQYIFFLVSQSDCMKWPHFY